jgi:aspartyl-tRNA(Asn)/glutamyl-tRNA(Gln) amidotransferase subunit B
MVKDKGKGGGKGRKEGEGKGKERGEGEGKEREEGKGKESEPKVIIGLEVHVQLTNLKTKLFCSCSTDYRGAEPNTHVCPICMGEPGTLPVLNEGAIEDAIMVALALGSNISRRTLFSRKNYFYPDMPKNFQISQYDGAGGIPFATGGSVSIGVGKEVRIRRIQIEEDPGRLVYEGTIDASPFTLVDYNRAGLPLIEIVTEPDIESPKEARMFLQSLRSILEHLGVFDESLQGAMRCDANISIRGGKRVEIKNISSFKDVERALSFEITRQKGLLARGLKVGMETRHWDDLRRITVSLRIKEEEQDYRYFPEPDLVPITISEDLIAKVKARMPILPSERKKIFADKYGIPLQTAEVLVSSKAMADFFEECIKLKADPLTLANWLTGDLKALLNEMEIEIWESKVTPAHMAELLSLMKEGILSGKMAKEVLKEVVATGKMPRKIVEERGLRTIASMESLKEVVERVFSENPEAVRDALRQEKAVHFLIGQVMKATKGSADPLIANEAVRKKLEEIASLSSSSSPSLSPSPSPSPSPSRT